MPRDKNFKKLVRARQRDTGEVYTRAREALRPATLVPGATWGRAQERLDALREYTSRTGSSAVVVVRGGKLVDAWGAVDTPMDAIAMRNAFVSTLFGIHRIDTSATLEALDVDDTVPPHLTPVQRRATVEHLLQSRSGIVHESAYGSANPAELETPDPSPGETFLYSNWDFNALVTVFGKLTGLDVFAEIDEKIATPIGMQDYRPGDGRYFHQSVSEHPACLFEVSARDLARFGLLYLRQGRWSGTQVVPRAWVRRSLTAHTADNVHKADFGFGYSWWIHPGHRLAGHRFYALLAGTGHAVFLVPDLDLVVVHRVSGWHGPTKWPDVWPVLELAAGTRAPGDVTTERTGWLQALWTGGPRNLEFRDDLQSWTARGEVAIDPDAEYELMPSVRIRGATLQQRFDGRGLRGARLRLTGNVRGDATVWLGSSELRRSGDWRREELFLDVGEDVHELSLGIRGECWANQLTLEPAPTW